jgi:hypothetical protein
MIRAYVHRLKFFTLLLALFTFALTGASQGSKSKGSASSKPKIDPALAAAAKPFVSSGCDATLWQHVYHPQRLTVVENCISVAGVIHHAKKEPDGDEHIQLQLDADFPGLLNDKNNTVQASCLVIEPICQNVVTQADAMASCRDFHSDVDMPKKGAHVRVLGSYVWDTEAGHGWMEIHPVTKIDVIQ